MLSFFLFSHAGAFRGLCILFLVQVSSSKPAHSSLSIFFASASGVKTAGAGAGLVSLSVLSAPVFARAQGWTPFALVHVSVAD